MFWLRTLHQNSIRTRYVTRPRDISANSSTAPTLTVVILTFNESRHIERCIRSAQKVADDILVVDSYSSDDTVIQAQQLGGRVIQHPWLNHSTQMNWALSNGNVISDWVMRIDADEFLDDRLAVAVKRLTELAGDEIGGFEVNRRIRFMGQFIRHGGMAPMWVTRLWRNGWAQCEARWMDEHMIMSRGCIARLPGLLIDDNLNSLAWWTQKHNTYSSHEAVDYLTIKHHAGLAKRPFAGLNRQARAKRWFNTRIYGHLPLGLRPWAYFFYRLVLRVGFLDGPRGVMFHTLQGLWYRLLVDAKVMEVQRAMTREGWNMPRAVHHVLGVDMNVDRNVLSERKPA